MPFKSPISKITSQLFLCGVGCLTEDRIKEKGITHILNTAEELRDFKYPVGDDVMIKHIVMKDNDKEDLLKFLDTCVDYVDYVHRCGGNILVHCVAGVSRSASVCLAYLVKYRDTTLRKAYYHILNKRPCIYPNFGFWRQLCVYEEQIRGTSSVELLPLVIGLVPDIMKNDAEYRIKLAWMPELYCLFTVHFLIMLIQVICLSFS